MQEVTVAELRAKTEMMKAGEILHVRDGRKREGIGYFIPEKYTSVVTKVINDLERSQKRALLQRVAEAQKLDRIEEGTVGDGLEKG